MNTATLGGQAVTVLVGREALATPAVSPFLGLDVESTYMGDAGQFGPGFRVRTVQFGAKVRAWVYDLADPEQRARAAAILADPGRSFCSHTNMDVLAVWREFGIDISGRNVDTRMLATQADPDRDDDRDLKTLAANYGMPELKAADDELKAWMRERWTAAGGKRNAAAKAVEEAGWNALAAIPASEWPDVFTRYAGLDAVACRRLFDLLVPATRAPAALLATDQWLHTQSNRIQMRGLRVDREALDALSAEASGNFTEAKRAAEELTGGVNINGPKFLDWMAEHGVDWSTWPGATAKTGPSLAKDNLLLIGDYPLDGVGRQVFDLRVTQQRWADLKTKTEGVTRALVEEDGVWRIHPLLNPIGASTTARMSSSGPNVQNFSKRDPRMRGIFLPEPGHVLATADFAQVELRVVAALAREEKMIGTIIAGGDLHQLTVDELAAAGVTITRDTAKIVNFLIVYGGGPSALHQQTGIPMEQCRLIIDTWRERYPSIQALSQWLGRERDAIRTVSDRRLPVTRVKGTGDRAGDRRTYANINYAVQSAARELLVDAWMSFASMGHAEKVWWPIHDELVLQIPDDPDVIAGTLADVEKAMTMEFRGVPIVAEALVLRDRDGVSRWMTGRLAETIKKEQAA